jgi:hypothetical protein
MTTRCKGASDGADRAAAPASELLDDAQLPQPHAIRMIDVARVRREQILIRMYRLRCPSTLTPVQNLFLCRCSGALRSRMFGA